MNEEQEMFKVAQFFQDGTHELFDEEKVAMEAFSHFCSLVSSVGAGIGTTVEVRIVDAMDNTVAQWVFGKGIVFPTPEHIANMKSGELKFI